MALSQTVKLWLQGLFDSAAGSTDPATDISRMYRQQVHYIKDADDAADATATAAITFHKAPTAATVLGVDFLPTGVVTADNTNYATLFLYKGDGTTTPATVVGSVTTQITGGGSTADGVPYPLTLTTANVGLDAGDILGFAITKTGTGVTVVDGTLIVYLEEV